MITMTELASRKTLNSLNKRGKGLGIKIGVRTTGCSGLAYTLEYVDRRSFCFSPSWEKNHFPVGIIGVFSVFNTDIISLTLLVPKSPIKENLKSRSVKLILPGGLL